MFPCAYFVASQVKRCLENNIPELVRVLEEGFRHLALGPEGGIVQPQRHIVPVKDASGELLSMPAYIASGEALATKVVTSYPNNRSPLPSIQGVVLLFHAGTGALKCVMDAIEITAYRTAAASAVATKVRIWNHRESSAASLVQELAAHGISARYEASAEDAVRDADVVVTATSSPKPVLQAGWLKKGAHVNAVGAPRPDWQELSEELMRQAVVYVDSTEGARTESGDVIISGADIFAEIGEVVLGAKENRRSDTTVFKSLGMAMEDVLAADLVYRHLSNDKS
ncbi:ketimine reductase mu-crystallin isoform X2 [Dermacentor andersoni]|uniref:ketimine reductase mu-crystallin isoform X2 n=1 Tax=Dermacentor andersoni TaxID=34620 RepID=UPI003B3A2171